VAKISLQGTFRRHGPAKKG
jgi:hypothetical protein